MVSEADTRSVPRSFPRTGDMTRGGGWGGADKKRVGDIGAVGPRRDAIPTMGVVRPTPTLSPCPTPVPLGQFYADFILHFHFLKKTKIKMRQRLTTREKT